MLGLPKVEFFGEDMGVWDEKPLGKSLDEKIEEARIRRERFRKMMGPLHPVGEEGLR